MSTAWCGTPHIGIAPPLASFEREVNVQLQRPRRRQRVLVEHLVEVAHAEEHHGVAVLPLGVEILPHRRRGAGRLGERGGKSSAAWNEVLADRVAVASITLSLLAFSA